MNQVLLNIIALSCQGFERNNRIIAFSVARQMTIFDICDQFFEGLKTKYSNKWNDQDMSSSIEVADEIYNLIENLNLNFKTAFEPITE